MPAFELCRRNRNPSEGNNKRCCGDLQKRRGRPPVPAVCILKAGQWSFFDCGASTAAPAGKIALHVARHHSAAGQRRKPVAALFVDWFYVTSSFTKWAPSTTRDRVLPFLKGPCGAGRQLRFPLHLHYAPGAAACQAVGSNIQGCVSLISKHLAIAYSELCGADAACAQSPGPAREKRSTGGGTRHTR